MWEHGQKRQDKAESKRGKAEAEEGANDEDKVQSTLFFDVPSGSYKWRFGFLLLTYSPLDESLILNNRSADGGVNTARRPITPTMYDLLEIGAGTGASIDGLAAMNSENESGGESDTKDLKIMCVEPSEAMRCHTVLGDDTQVTMPSAFHISPGKLYILSRCSRAAHAICHCQIALYMQQ